MKQPAAAADAPAGGPVAELHGPVLVVEEDLAVQRVLRLVLEGAGYRCIGCAGVDDAPALVDMYHPRLVLAEARLGASGGQELARRLAEREGWHPRLALMSAYPRPRPGREDYFIPKPIEFDRLLHLLDSVEHDFPG